MKLNQKWFCHILNLHIFNKNKSDRKFCTQYAQVLLKTISWRPHPSRSRRRWQRVSSCGGSNFLIGRTWGRRGGIGRVSLPNESSDASSAYSSRRRPSCNVDTCNSLHKLTLVYELNQITASLSHLRTMLPEISSCPQPAQRPNHAT